MKSLSFNLFNYPYWESGLQIHFYFKTQVIKVEVLKLTECSFVIIYTHCICYSKEVNPLSLFPNNWELDV